jgi:hypothetical protein
MKMKKKSRHPGLEEALRLLTVTSVEGQPYNITKGWNKHVPYMVIGGEIRLACGEHSCKLYRQFMVDLAAASEDGKGELNKGFARFPRFTLFIRPSVGEKPSALQLQITHKPSLYRLNSWREEMSLMRAARPQRDYTFFQARDISYKSSFADEFPETFDLLGQGVSEAKVLEWIFNQDDRVKK